MSIAIRKNEQTDLIDVIRIVTGRGLDFVILDEFRKRIRAEEPFDQLEVPIKEQANALKDHLFATYIVMQEFLNYMKEVSSNGSESTRS